MFKTKSNSLKLIQYVFIKAFFIQISYIFYQNLGPFKCGADWAWKQSDEMYNPEWEDIWMQNLEMQDPMDPKGKNKGKKQAAATKKNPGDINIHLVDNNKNIIA